METENWNRPNLGSREFGVSPEQFVSESVQVNPQMLAPTIGTPKMIVAHLRADRTLDPKTPEALSIMIRLAYEAAAQGQLGKQQQEQG